jgi:hypothetical protein
MPFKSAAQRRKFAELLVEGKISPETFEEWNRETGSKKAPRARQAREEGEAEDRGEAIPAKRKTAARPRASGSATSLLSVSRPDIVVRLRQRHAAVSEWSGLLRGADERAEDHRVSASGGRTRQVPIELHRVRAAAPGSGSEVRRVAEHRRQRHAGVDDLLVPAVVL